MIGYRVFASDGKLIGRVESEAGSYIVVAGSTRWRRRRWLPRRLMQVDRRAGHVTVSLSRALIRESPAFRNSMDQAVLDSYYEGLSRIGTPALSNCGGVFADPYRADPLEHCAQRAPSSSTLATVRHLSRRRS